MIKYVLKKQTKVIHYTVDNHSFIKLMEPEDATCKIIASSTDKHIIYSTLARLKSGIRYCSLSSFVSELYLVSENECDEDGEIIKCHSVTVNPVELFVIGYYKSFFSTKVLGTFHDIEEAFAFYNSCNEERMIYLIKCNGQVLHSKNID